MLYDDSYYESGIFDVPWNDLSRERRSASNHTLDVDALARVPYRATLERNFVDLYGVPDRLTVSPSKSRRLRYRMSEELADGGHRKAALHLLRGSEVGGMACATTDGRYAGFWVYIIQGVDNFRSWAKAHTQTHLARCDSPGCVASFFVGTRATCGQNETRLSLTIPDTDDYVLVLYLPSMGLTENVLSAHVNLDIKSRLYSPGSYEEPMCKHVFNCTTPPRSRLLLDMPYYYGDVTLTPEDAVIVSCACVPHTLLYVCCFCIVPLVLMTIVIAIFVDRRRRHQKSFMERFNARSQGINAQGVTYGSLDRASSFAASTLEAVPPADNNPEWSSS